MLNTGQLITAINQYVKSIPDYPVYRNVTIDWRTCSGFTFSLLSHKPFHIEHKFTTICYELLIRIYIIFLPFIFNSISKTLFFESFSIHRRPFLIGKPISVFKNNFSLFCGSIGSAAFNPNGSFRSFVMQAKIKK